MKKFLLFTAASFLALSAFGQTQIGNGDMESWPNDDEPENWNSFLTASGAFSGAASDQCDESSDTRPGSSGSSSARIFSTSTFGIIANGNLTLGKVNMGSITPASSENYNWTEAGNADHSEALTDQPDSIVFWAMFTPNGGNGNARMKATLHTDYNYRDPEDGAAANEVVATAVVNYPSTGGNWQRFAVAFDYAGPAAIVDQAYILVTFTTNETPGGGDGGDQVWIDDVELIYNDDASVNELDNDGIVVSMNNEAGIISVDSPAPLNGTYSVYNTMGQTIQTGEVMNEIPFANVPGVYYVHIAANNKAYKFEILKN